MEFSAVADCEARPCSPRLVPLCRCPPLPIVAPLPARARGLCRSGAVCPKLGADSEPSVSPRNWGKTLHSSPFHVIPLVNQDFPNQKPCVLFSIFGKKNMSWHLRQSNIAIELNIHENPIKSPYILLIDGGFNAPTHVNVY